MPNEINPGDFLSIVTSVQLKLWGSELLLECLDDPVDRRPYVLIFKDCREIHWNIYGEDADLHDSETDLIGILLGEDKHRKPATITTGAFELSVLYGDFEIQKKPELLESQVPGFERGLQPAEENGNVK